MNEHSTDMMFVYTGMPRESITITLPDGSTREGKSWETTPMSVALSISKGLADKTVIAKVRWTAKGS